MPKTIPTRSRWEFVSFVTDAQSRSSLLTVIRPELVGPALLAVALCGFWLYLGALAVIGVAPRTAITGGYYAVLGALMWAWVVLRRRRLMQNLLGSRWPRIATASAVILFMWFEVAALTSATTLSHRFAALVLLSSVPAAFVAASLDEEELLCAVRLVVRSAGRSPSSKWLQSAGDPSADGSAQFPTSIRSQPHRSQLSAPSRCWLSAHPASAVRGLRSRCSRCSTLAVLLPGSRGPLLAVSVAAIVILSRRTRRVALITVTVMVLSGTAGYSLASRLGSAGHLTADLSHSGPWSGETVAASSAEERVWLIRHAIRAGARHLFAGNGVGNLSDYSRTSSSFRLRGAARTRMIRLSKPSTLSDSRGLRSSCSRSPSQLRAG